jgi:hypothetical protein
VIVLSDVRPSDLAQEEWDAIVEAATRRGGSVIILVNDIGILRAYESDPRLSTLLPYRSGLQAAWRSWPGQQPAFRPVPSRGAEDAPIARLADEPSDDSTGNAEAWQRLPALYQYLVMPELKPSTRALLVERESGAPIVTETHVGAGRSFLIGINETWRWRRLVGERVQDRFWLQLIRSASDPPYAAHDNGLWLDADKLVTSPDEPLHVRVRAEQPDGSPLAAGQLRLQLMHGQQRLADIALQELSSSAAGRYEAEVRDLPAEPGEYALRLENFGNPGRSVSLPIRIAAPNDEAEMVDISGDPAFLRRLAEASGGEMIPLDRLGTLPQRLADVRARQSGLTEYTLWDSPYLFAFVLACLGAEWALRKRFGLA